MGTHLSLPDTCNSVVVRKGNYRGRCPSYGGRKFTDGMTPWENEIHHILCEHAITDFSVPADKFEYIGACLCVAKWDINKKSNLIGLPMKQAYIDAHGKAPTNLPCHDVDHNTKDGYTNEVKQWIHKKIWNTLVANQKTHKIEAKSIVKQLNGVIRHFKQELGDRGRRNGGTVASWQRRFDDDKWCHPFSMAMEPRGRAPGRDGDLPIFTMIG